MCHVTCAAAFRCYACGDQSQELPSSVANNSFQLQLDNVPKSCNEMQNFLGAAKNPFILDCPDGMNGCVTKSTGKLKISWISHFI
jgi:hypothetical protein